MKKNNKNIQNIHTPKVCNFKYPPPNNERSELEVIARGDEGEKNYIYTPP